jgi:MFS family permease
MDSTTPKSPTAIQRPSGIVSEPARSAGGEVRAGARAFVIAWAFALLFYFLEYAVRSSPSVMIPQLASAFHTTALGVGSILVFYFYTYSIVSLIAGAALDHLGAKRPVPAGAAMLGVGCLLFSVPAVVAGDVGRLLQGAGSAFAFTGAVYLAAHGFSPRRQATAIGATQSLGMLGGSAGQFAVAPMIEHGLGAKAFWVGMGMLCLINAALLYVATPRERLAPGAAGRGGGGWLTPYKVVFSNPQSWLSGIVAGLLFAPTTIGAMIWAVPVFEKDIQFSYHAAVITASLVPLGWAIGCPLLGWLSDRIGRRKPVIFGGGALMALAALYIAYSPTLTSVGIAMLVFGIASGAAMIPYSVIKEVNPDRVKGSATGGINFLVFGMTAAIGPIHARMIGKTLATTANHVEHFRAAGIFWVVCCAAAMVLTLLLRETGRASQARVQATQAT